MRNAETSKLLKRLAPLALALMLDVVVGEPPEAVHPVVWMGKLLSLLEARAPRGAMGRFLYGAVLAVALPRGWARLAHALERIAPWPLQAIMLKPAFAGRELLEAGARVKSALDRNELDAARHQLRRLVSRPTGNLDSQLIAAAAIESTAENLVDSWLAPLLAYALFGMAGAYAYRAINTADAMWGYRNSHYEHLGKPAARVDDAANFLPARIAAAILCCSAAGDWRRAAAIWRADAYKTASPNAGQAMACVAGALNVRLEKSGHYVLNPCGRTPAAEDIAHAIRLVARAMGVSAAFVASVRLVRSD